MKKLIFFVTLGAVAKQLKIMSAKSYEFAVQANEMLGLNLDYVPKPADQLKV